MPLSTFLAELLGARFAGPQPPADLRVLFHAGIKNQLATFASIATISSRPISKARVDIIARITILGGRGITIRDLCTKGSLLAERFEIIEPSNTTIRV
uniref:Uncharacterized protein n=1 Tax=Candidatus Kentrum sp. LPFa TaxID=2126335 RepID=A0A450WK41_9GAMM|nr:MAG: hypothetical protein BECKLPF1236B_GA0070989_111611 [Candidatus Kentron sp. LPFa]